MSKRRLSILGVIQRAYGVSAIESIFMSMSLASSENEAPPWSRTRACHQVDTRSGAGQQHAGFFERLTHGCDQQTQSDLGVGLAEPLP